MTRYVRVPIREGGPLRHPFKPQCSSNRFAVTAQGQSSRIDNVDAKACRITLF